MIEEHFTTDRFGRLVSLYTRNVITLTEIIYAFFDFVRFNSDDVLAELYRHVTPEMDAEIRRIVSWSELDFYQRVGVSIETPDDKIHHPSPEDIARVLPLRQRMRDYFGT